jgi:phospholipid/cholesterol/gamma-HCH transport system ATP-binding protein
MTVPRGKIVAIMGLSGCGKTTVLRMISGVLKPNSGTVKVGGRVVSELDQDALYEMRRKMGMLFQFGALFTDMSALENVAFQMREHTALPESMILDLALMKLNAVGLRGAQHMLPSELSGGMARRVALARTIALDPMLIMYDEPFTGLDPITMGVISNLIRRLNEVLGTTSIIVTHDVQESLKIVDYAYFMADGAVVAEGTPEDIRNTNAPFVHQFVWGEVDGPMPFHYPGAPYAADLDLEERPRA